MKISKIIIDNFRSIKHTEVTVDKFNIFVGQNNHGKTNFFEAIDWFYNGKGDLDKIRCGRMGDTEISVEIEFIEISDGIEKMKNEKNKTTIKNLLGESNSVRVKRTSLQPKVRKMYGIKKGDWLDKNPAGFDNAFNDFLPKFEYVSTKMNPLDVAKYGKNTPITNMLTDVLTAILEQNSEYAEFRSKFDTLFTNPTSGIRVKMDELSDQVKLYIEKQFSDCHKVVFEVAPPSFEDLLKNFEISIDDGVYTEAEEKGDGMQRALMLAIIQVYANFRKKNEESSKYFLFFIDEGELHLHPSAQRKLKNALLEISQKGDQVFINTHSSVLVVDDQDNQVVFRVEKINKETNINIVKDSEKPGVVYELLGGSPSDLLLPKNFFIVEGKSDLEFINKVISRFYSEKPSLQIIPADGDLSQTSKSLNSVDQMFKPLGSSIYKQRVVIYVDKHQEHHVIAFQRNHPELFSNGQFFQSTSDSIEEYYPSPWSKTQDQVRSMSNDLKIELAREVGVGISKEDFEKKMPKLYEALNKCWTGAFN